MANEVEGIPHLEPEEVEAKYLDPNDRTIVIDVREREEYDQAHIPGVPLIPMGEIIDYIDDFDKDRAYVFVCRSGRRSLEVSKFFKSNGFEQVYNMSGGMLQWKSEVKSGLEKVLDTFDAARLEKQ